jgi:hypothetical protein
LLILYRAQRRICIYGTNRITGEALNAK